jgi:hypothetical protein
MDQQVTASLKIMKNTIYDIYTSIITGHRLYHSIVNDFVQCFGLNYTRQTLNNMR